MASAADGNIVVQESNQDSTLVGAFNDVGQYNDQFALVIDDDNFVYQGVDQDAFVLGFANDVTQYTGQDAFLYSQDSISAQYSTQYAEVFGALMMEFKLHIRT